MAKPAMLYLIRTRRLVFRLPVVKNCLRVGQRLNCWARIINSKQHYPIIGTAMAQLETSTSLAPVILHLEVGGFSRNSKKIYLTNGSLLSSLIKFLLSRV